VSIQLGSRRGIDQELDTAVAAEARSGRHGILPYVKIARPDHWFKNVFMLPGALLVLFFDAGFLGHASFPKMVVGLISACLIASSNYVLNEILDAESDKFHPQKCQRPIPSGQISIPVAYAEWVLFALVGFALGIWVGWLFAACGFLMWMMGMLYNLRPVRLKDVPYADVLSESLNNPLRMAMGWYATGYASCPTLSGLIAYWMLGAFFMATKRFAEYRMIGHAERAASYRRSFAHYGEERLLSSIIFYASLFALFSGVFIARYRVELVLAAPLICLFVADYLHLAFTENSPVQHPERLFRARSLVALAVLALLACVILLFVDLPLVQDLFKQWYEWNPQVPV
jgi:4-hydroxybenzoate polyprenyltransferase